MSQVHIVTDGTVQFTAPAFAETHEVTIVPVGFRSRETGSLRTVDGDLAGHEHLFADPMMAPFIASPSVDQMAQAYSSALNATDQVLSIHVSSSITPAVANAEIASQQFLGRCHLQVIDSQMVSVGLGLLVQEAVAAAGRGLGIDDVVRVVRGMIPRLYLVFFLEELLFLERHHLISRSQAILGNMLGIIAFLTLEDGRIVPMEKVRTRGRALEKLVDFVSEFSDVEHLALLEDGRKHHSDTKLVADRLRSMYPDTPISVTGYNPSLATYVGLNSLGVVVLEAKEASR